MRKLVSTLMAVTLMLVSATACAERITPSKNYVTKKVNVGSFNAISTSSSVDVIYIVATYMYKRWFASVVFQLVLK